jgi:hypothetical protein
MTCKIFCQLALNKFNVLQVCMDNRWMPILSQAYRVEVYSHREANETSKVLGRLPKISRDKTCYRRGFGAEML